MTDDQWLKIEHLTLTISNIKLPINLIYKYNLGVGCI